MDEFFDTNKQEDDNIGAADNRSEESGYTVTDNLNDNQINDAVLGHINFQNGDGHDANQGNGVTRNSYVTSQCNGQPANNMYSQTIPNGINYSGTGSYGGNAMNCTAGNYNGGCEANHQYNYANMSPVNDNFRYGSNNVNNNNGNNNCESNNSGNNINDINKNGRKGFFPKLLTSVAFGVAFGVCAGISIYAVNSITGGGVISTSYDGESEKIIEMEKTLDSLQDKLNAVNQDTNNQASSTSSGIPINNVTSVTSDVTSVVDKVMPSMVSVTNIYEEVYSNFFYGGSYTQEAEASGSGIIIGENDSEYLLVTNYHVIENCVQLSVQFADGKKADAHVKGFDSSVDIAVIAVTKDDMDEDTKKVIAVAELGNSDNLKIGEPAIAIGNALGYGQSVTTGVISALNCDIQMENTCTKLIQTNAAINPGNSGGALLNIAGQVVGINSNKIGGASIEGMGYAIPISEVKEIIANLMKHPTMVKVSEDERGYLGIQGENVDETTTQAYGIPQGVYITKVITGSAAEKAGLLKGDVITKLDGQTIKSMAELQKALEYYKGGDEATVTVMRSGAGEYSEQEVKVVLSTRSVVESVEDGDDADDKSDNKSKEDNSDKDNKEDKKNKEDKDSKEDRDNADDYDDTYDAFGFNDFDDWFSYFWGN